MAEDIARWLNGLGLGQYAQAFAENGVDIEALPLLRDEDFKQLGVLLGHTRKLQAAIEVLSANETATRSIPFASQEPKGEPAEAERRQLTIMFCDLVGSTELSARLDPEDLRDIMRQYQDSVVGAVTRYDGYVAKYLGDGVLAYFGWPQAHEDQAERAVRSGLGAIAAVENVRLDGGLTLRARIGISTGQVVVGDLVGDEASDGEAVTGETPNLAARLQGAAMPGQVVIGSVTRRLIGTTFKLNELGQLKLKGFSQSIPAWSVIGEGSAESRFEATHSDSLTRLVGRENELALIGERWELAKGGEGQAVLLSGEAGIGKSRIVRAVRDLVAQDRHYRLRYQCSPYHSNSAFYPIIQRLERAAGITMEDANEVKIDKLESLLKLSAVDLESIAPLFAALLSLPAEDRYGTLDLTPGQRRDHTFAALVGQVLALSRQRPVLFEIEDVHWIDPTTQDFVGEVIAQIADAPVFVLVTHRPEFVPPWTSNPHLTSLTLNRLSRSQGAKIVEAFGAAKLSGAVTDSIVARADGVPLFVEELTKSVLEAGDTEGTPIAVDAIPATLQASLTARLDRLDDAKRIAQIGAAIGREYSYELIAAVSEESEENLMPALDRLVEAELVFRTVTTQSTVYTYKHALIQEVAYESMLKSRRSQLHRRIAEILKAMFPTTVETEPEVLALHYSLANMIEPAIVYWRRAGELSSDASANIEATSHFEKALDLLDSLPESNERDQLELELQIALAGPMLMTKGPVTEVGDAYVRARELCQKLGDSPQIVPALFGMWRYYIGRGDCTISRDIGRQLLELGKSADDITAAVLGHYGFGYASFCYGDLVESRIKLEEGFKLYDRNMRDEFSVRLGQDPGVACLAYGALALWVLGYPDQAKRITQKAVTLAQELSHPFSSAFAYSLACQVLQHRGEVDELRKASESAIGISREQGFSLWLASPKIFRGWVRSQQENSIEGTLETQEAVQLIADTGMEMRRPYYLSLVAEGYILAENFVEARLILDQALAIVTKTNEHWSEAELLRLIGEIEVREDTNAAEIKFKQALTVARSQGAKSWELRTATSLAHLWRGQGKTDDARNLLQPVYDWFTEGFDTLDLKEAKTLLHELS